MTLRATTSERALAILLPRVILGFVYLFAGIHKIADVGPAAYGQAMAMSDGARFLPVGVLTAVGVVVPFMELVLGLLVLAGWHTRPALRALAALVVLIAAGYGVGGLLHPMGATAMGSATVNTFILPRAALLIVTLMQPAEDDLLSIDGLLAARAKS
jgi:uncharacterized membrane protein YphA (DoxX/SURF4 family)